MCIWVRGFNVLGRFVFRAFCFVKRGKQPPISLANLLHWVSGLPKLKRTFERAPNPLAAPPT